LENSFNALPLSEQAFKRLRIDILNGSLGPDKQLKVENLKKFYGFSSSPLREALNRLTVEGLVINEERRGFFVSSISVEDINEITRLRCLLETEALRDSISNGEDSWEAQIIATHYRLERAEGRNTSKKPFITDAEWNSIHEEFHDSLLAACTNQRLLKMRSTLYYQAERYWHLWANANPEPVNRGSDHKNIMDAVLNREGERASILITNHISHTTKIVVKFLEKL